MNKSGVIAVCTRDCKFFPPRRSQALFVWLSVILCLALTGIPNGVRAEIYDYAAVPQAGETFGTTLFRLYVPDSVPEIKGIYFRVEPHLADSRPFAADPTFQALCESVEFGLMGALLDDMDMDTGVGNAVLRALATFAQASSHPEIEHTTIFFEGYSWGGQFSYHFTKWLPARVIGIVTMKGGYHDTSPAGDAIYVPGYLFIGEFDLPYRIENLTSIFEAHRPLGARWILAVQPGAGHEYVDDRTLLDEYFHTVIELRLPEMIPPDEPPVLLTIPEPDGWLGDRDTFLIGSWACYNATAGSACWFVSRDVGVSWQEFVSAGAVTDTIPCPTAVEPGANELSGLSRVLQNYPNPFNPHTIIPFAVDSPQHVTISVYDLTGHRVAVLADQMFGLGTHYAGWNGKDTAGQAVSSGNYVVRMETEGYIESQKITLVR